MRFLFRTIIFLHLATLPVINVFANPTAQHTLPNGLKIIVQEDHRAPTVTQMVWYKIGAIDEHNGITGISHVLEHMMFKGTKNLKPGDFSARVAALGGTENAFTSKDYTAYFEQVEHTKLEKVMALEADRMENLVFDNNEFTKEIAVVMEERRMRTDDQAISQVHEALNAAAFNAHPYHHPTIGWMSDLKHLQISDIKHWYDTWYAPNNATLVICGDVKAQEVFALAKKYFSHIKSKNLPTRKPQDEPTQQGIKRITVKAPAENPYIALAFKTPTLRNVDNDVDVYALQILATILNGYDNARLNARLIRTNKVANEVGADYSPIARGPELFILDATPAANISTQELEVFLRAEITDIVKNGIPLEELTRVKTKLIAEQIYKRDSLFGQAIEIGMMETTGLSHQQKDKIIEKLNQVTVEQIQTVAKRYFNDDNLTVATLVPLPISEKAKQATHSNNQGILH